jgi:hypothetical protein
MTGLDTRPPSSPRSRKKAIWITVAVVAVVGVAVGLALFQPWKIFTRNTVNEAAPVAAAVQNDAVTAPALSVSSMNTSAPAAPGTPAPTQTTAPIQTTAAATTPETSTPEDPATEAPAPAAAPTEPVVLAAGTFVDGEHATSGTATILQLPDGSRFVRLEGFSTSDGPDVDVWVTDEQAGGDDWGKYDDGRYVSLGDLKGTDGNQNYAIPADADLSGLTSVVIWCDRFNVAFGSAAVTL